MILFGDDFCFVAISVPLRKVLPSIKFEEKKKNQANQNKQTVFGGETCRGRGAEALQLSAAIAWERPRSSPERLLLPREEEPLRHELVRQELIKKSALGPRMKSSRLYRGTAARRSLPDTATPWNRRFGVGHGSVQRPHGNCQRRVAPANNARSWFCAAVLLCHMLTDCPATSRCSVAHSHAGVTSRA